MLTEEMIKTIKQGLEDGAGYFTWIDKDTGEKVKMHIGMPEWKDFIKLIKGEK